MVKVRWQSGFTLIEIVIGIVVLAISLTLIVPVLLPGEEQSADQIHQIRAAELGQSLINEILAKSYDENSDHTGGAVRCDEIGAPACSAQAAFGPDGENRAQFDDVDDYITNGFTGAILTANNQSIANQYQGFAVNIEVNYDGLTLGLASLRSAKRIVIQVRTPSGFVIQFATFKANF